MTQDAESVAVSGELRLAILDMDKSVSCLRYELPGSVWDDVFKKWDAVRKLVTGTQIDGRDDD